MNKEEKNKMVVERLVENLQKYAQNYLKAMLETYILEFRRDLLFQEKEFNEEIYIAFPGYGQDLKIEPVDYEVRKNLSFAFTFSGTYEQLEVGKYTYRYEGHYFDDMYITDNLRREMKKKNINILSEDSDVDGTAPYTMIVLDKPFHHKNMELQGVEIRKPAIVLGTGKFEVPLNVTFKSEAGRFRFDSMYLSDPSGNREECLRDGFNRPICLISLDQIFHTIKLFENGPEMRITKIISDSHGELPDKYLGIMPGEEALEIDAEDIEISDAERMECDAKYHRDVEERSESGAADTDTTDNIPQDLMKADAGEIEFSHKVLTDKLITSLKKRLFHPLDLDEDWADEDPAQTGQKANAEKKAKTPKERAEDILSDFAIFHYRTKHNLEYMMQTTVHPELCTARYNLLIRANEMERALEFVDILRKNVSPEIDGSNCKILNEGEIVMPHQYPCPIEEREEKGLYPDETWLYEIPMIFVHNDLVVIHHCLEKPVLRTGEIGTGSEMEAIKKAIKWYEQRWKVIALSAKQKNAARLIVIGDDIAYRTTLRYNADIYEVVCDSHLWLEDLTPDEVYQLFMAEMEEGSFGKTLTDEFKEEVKKYIQSVYPKSEIRGLHFIDDHLSKIFTKYILKENQGDSLIDCVPKYKMPSVERILQELKGKTGLQSVAERFETIYAMKDVLVRAGEPYHMSFEGNPGTGKTMVARMMAEMLFHMGVTKRPKLVEMRAGEFKSMWRGGTVQQVKGRIREAYGGVLFIDEAYILADDEYQNGLSILLMEMADRDNRERPVVIFAGYGDRMRDLLKSNEGLDSRIKYHVEFRDYTRDELKEILKGKLQELGHTTEDSEEVESLLDDLILEKMSNEFFGNARDMEKLCFELLGIWGEKKKENEKNKKYAQPLIRAEHIKALLPGTDTESLLKILEDQPELKEELDKFKSGVAYKRALQKSMDNVGVPAANLHMIFAGNPGTGKTTVAGMLADYLCEMHVLPTNKCIPVEAKDLFTYAKNMTPAQHTEDYINRARGGILFVDEAYALAKEVGGDEVIHVLLTAMEKYKRDTIFIFAGYPIEMDMLLGMNPGLRSRIGHIFRFRSYSEEVLAAMFINKMKDLKMSFENEEGVRNELKGIMRFFRRMDDFGNGRFVENLVNATMNKHGMRLAEKYPADKKMPDKRPALWNCPPEEIVTYTREDILTKKEILLTFFGIDRDPDEYEQREKETTVIHELGHATVAMAADKNFDPGVEKITIRSDYTSFGSVKFDPSKFRTERDYKVNLAFALGGRNAEKLYFGSHTRGCSGDYDNAKKLAKQMVSDFAMGDLGVTSDFDLLREADAWATKLLYENKEFIDEMKPFLLKYEELDGKELKEIYDIYRNSGLEKMKAHLPVVEKKIQQNQKAAKSANAGERKGRKKK